MKKLLAILCSVILCCGMAALAMMLALFTGCGKADKAQTTTEYHIEQDDNVVEDPF